MPFAQSEERKKQREPFMFETKTSIIAGELTIEYM